MRNCEVLFEVSLAFHIIFCFCSQSVLFVHFSGSNHVNSSVTAHSFVWLRSVQFFVAFCRTIKIIVWIWYLCIMLHVGYIYSVCFDIFILCWDERRWHSPRDNKQIIWGQQKYDGNSVKWIIMPFERSLSASAECICPPYCQVKMVYSAREEYLIDRLRNSRALGLEQTQTVVRDYLFWYANLPMEFAVFHCWKLTAQTSAALSWEKMIDSGGRVAGTDGEFITSNVFGRICPSTFSHSLKECALSRELRGRMTDDAYHRHWPD